MTFTLHDYQLEIVNKARKEIAKGNKGVLIQSPPGSGKSVIIAEVIKNATQRKNEVLFLVHRKELAEQIEGTLRFHGADMNHVQILTVIKAVNRLSVMKYPRIIVTDESHHSKAVTYKKIYDYFSDSIHLGFTATPWRMSGEGFTDQYDSAIFGHSVDWLINNKKLAPFKYLSVKLIDDKKLKKNGTDYSSKSIDDAFEKGIYGDVVENYIKHANGQRAILYAHKVEASQEFADEFNSKGIKAVHADAKTAKGEREKIMQDFRDGTIQILCNVDLISEGFDVPDCTCVIMARPTQSLVLYMQQSMRSMRYKPDKLATIIDHVGNYARFGLPNQQHDWERYFNGGWKKKRGQIIDDDAPKLKDCENCFAIFDSKEHGRTCPHCGYEQPLSESELEQIQAELQVIEPFQIDYTLINYASKDKSELETLEDHYLFAKAKNMKESWIKFAYMPAKSWSWPQFYSELKPLKQKYNY